MVSTTAGIAVSPQTGGENRRAGERPDRIPPPRSHRVRLPGTIPDRPDASGGCNPVRGVPLAPITLCPSDDAGHGFPERIVIEDGPGTCLINTSIDGATGKMCYPSLIEHGDGMGMLALA